jgi:hypothetical protein
LAEAEYLYSWRSSVVGKRARKLVADGELVNCGKFIPQPSAASLTRYGVFPLGALRKRSNALAYILPGEAKNHGKATSGHPRKIVN